MKILSSFRDVSLSAAIQASNAKFDLHSKAVHNPGVLLILFGLILALAPLGAAQAQDLISTMAALEGTLQGIVNFIMNAAVVVGVLAIAYGIKLVIDKSNDRENVKNGHIVVSFVGGALMCMLWFVVNMMSSTVSTDGTIGERASW